MTIDYEIIEKMSDFIEVLKPQNSGGILSETSCHKRPRTNMLCTNVSYFIHILVQVNSLYVRSKHHKIGQVGDFLSENWQKRRNYWN